MQEAAVDKFRAQARKWQQQCSELLREHEEVMALPALTTALAEAPADEPEPMTIE